MAEEKSELEEEYEDAEADLEGVDPEDDAIEDVEDGEMFDDDDDEAGGQRNKLLLQPPLPLESYNASPGRYGVDGVAHSIPVRQKYYLFIPGRGLLRPYSAHFSL